MIHPHQREPQSPATTIPSCTQSQEHPPPSSHLKQPHRFSSPTSTNSHMTAMSPRPILALWLLALIVGVPSASPFVMGASSSGAAISNHPAASKAHYQHPNHHHHPQGNSNTRQTPTALGSHNDANQKNTAMATPTLQSSSDTATLPPPQPKKRFRRLRRLGQFIRGKDHGESNGDAWKQGEHGASLTSRLLFRYATPLLNLAGQRRLEVDDTLQVAPQTSMNTTVSSLTHIYYQTLMCQASSSSSTAASPSWLLTKALLQHQKGHLVSTGALRLLNTLVQAFPSILLARLLKLMEESAGTGLTQWPTAALTAVVSLVSVLMFKMVLENQYFHHVVSCSTQVRGSLSGLIFDKSLRLPGGGSGVTHQDDKKESDDPLTATSTSAAKKALGTGGVLNLMQSDASIIENASMQLHTIWDAPLQIAMYTALLYKYLGSSVFYGIAVLLMTIPLNSFTLRMLNRLAKHENEAKDARTKRTSESISNMKLLKLQGWEHQFAEDIRGHRHDELTRHSRRGVVRALNQAISNSVPALVLVVTLQAYVKTGQPIVASTIFTAISLFNQLRFPLFFYPMLIDSLANGRNAMKRISTYLASEEVIPYVEHLAPIENGGGGSIQVTNGNFLWTTDKAPKLGGVEGEQVAAAPALFDANLEVKPGEVVAVVGSVGSGKSALVKALLGELVPAPRAAVQQSISDEIQQPSTDVQTPSVVTHGNVAYCSQEAWLPKGTIRDAVVFGREYDEERYRAAIYDAGLDEDIVDESSSPKLSTGSGVLRHDTDVGESGSSLSGGQRARVALARALYAGADTRVFILDDCLAALDASVGSTVFERLTKRLKESGAATILVTNDPNLPRRCDRVVLMEKVPLSSSCATIADIGTYDELLSRGHRLASISSDDIQEPDQSKTEKGQHHGAVSPSIHKVAQDVVGVEKSKSGARHREKTIRVVGGYERPVNGTVDYCHADPERQVALEKCPDFIAQIDEEEVENKLSPIKDDSDETLSDSSSVGDSAATTSEKKPTKVASADDTMSTGAVPRKTYVKYLKSVRKPILIVAMLSAYFMANGAQFYQQFIVAKWTEIGRGDSMAAALGTKYLKSLVNAAGVVSVFLWLRSFLTNRVGVRASEYMHTRMLDAVFSAPMAFFDATPSGQLLSRFGKEMETVDRGVPDSIQSTLFCFLQIFMSAAALAGVVTPAMLVPILAVGSMYVSTMKRFRPGARELKRIETKTRSPIFTHFGEALRGSEIIRSIPGSRQFWSSNHRSMTDTNFRAFYSVKALDRWLSCRLETLGNIVVLTAALASVWLTRLGRLKSGSAGWGLTQSLAITGLMTWAVRCLTDLETNMMSVVRVEELTDIESEDVRMDKSIIEEVAKQTHTETSAPNEALAPLVQSRETQTVNSTEAADLSLDGWPAKGDVKFQNVSMKYNKYSKLVLKDVTLSLPPGTTLGIVGRTGSGKSSLLLTLFRLVEIENGGSIEIDGVDIRSVPLQRLRQSLAIIPQEPVLFAGTVAYNLDATGVASEESMWEALQAASPSLAAQFRQSGGLNTPITEGGKNLSLGQRQLLCLARALVRKSKILVLDEATASVDPTTDQEVQETIRREFVNKGVTVMTVAHRLETVLGYDKIAVLGDGELIEYGTPKDLLRIKNGELRRLVDADQESKKKGAKKSEDLISA